MQTTNQLSRRSFLSATLAGTVAPLVLPGRLFGADAPGRKLQLGAIGVGAMGGGNLGAFLGIDEVRVVAVCDVDSQRRASAVDKVNKKYGDTACRGYADFREMLGRGDLDLCSIAVPDHWHAGLYTAALKAGCDVYGEKPLARSIREGRAIANAQRRYGRVWQTGSWQRSTANFYQAAMLVRNGRIGKVSRVEVGLPRGRGGPVVAPSAPPPQLDWNFWLGPAPYKDFVKYSDRAPHWDWRWVMDYSGGQLTDWCGHHVDIAHWGLGLDRSGPVSVVGKGEYPEDGVYDVPSDYDITATYAGGLEIHIASRNPGGTKWIGEKGWVFVTRGRIDAQPASLLKEVIGADEIQLIRSANHHRNFIECVKSRQETITPAEVAHRSISVGLLGEIAMLTGRRIQWDPVQEEIIGDPGASALLGRPYREPWKLEV